MTRKFAGTLERYGLTLTTAVAAEGRVLDELAAHPRGRRQPWLRRALLLGIRCQAVPAKAIEVRPIEGKPTSKRVMVYLDRRVEEDGFILTQLEHLPQVRRADMLRLWLAIGTWVELNGTIVQSGAQLWPAGAKADFLPPAISQSGDSTSQQTPSPAEPLGPGWASAIVEDLRAKRDLDDAQPDSTRAPVDTAAPAAPPEAPAAPPAPAGRKGGGLSSYANLYD